MNSLQAVLLDLDGTLADTAPDMGAALNSVLAEQGLAPLAESEIRPHVSTGALGLLRLGFGAELEAARLEQLRERFLQFYAEHPVRHSCLFPGMQPLLEQLRAHGIPWGVVTNKPDRFTRPVLAGLGVLEQAACVVSGDTLSERKPHPAPVLHACRALGLAPQECLFVGDDRRDIIAGRSAGTVNLVALFGYLGDDGDPHDWAADGYIERPGDILDWLETH